MRNLERVHSLVDIIKGAVEILAICIAGFWTYSVFIRSEEPSLTARPEMTGRLSWRPAVGHPDACIAFFDVRVRNSTKATQSLSRMTATVTEIELPDTSGDVVDLLRANLHERRLTEIVEPGRADTSWRKKFAPGEGSTYQFAWLVKREPKRLLRFAAITNRTFTEALGLTCSDSIAFPANASPTP
jgi:hypothetical protein